MTHLIFHTGHHHVGIAEAPDDHDQEIGHQKGYVRGFSDSSIDDDAIYSSFITCTYIFKIIYTKNKH